LLPLGRLAGACFEPTGFLTYAPSGYSAVVVGRTALGARKTPRRRRARAPEKAAFGANRTTLVARATHLQIRSSICRSTPAVGDEFQASAPGRTTTRWSKLARILEIMSSPFYRDCGSCRTKTAMPPSTPVTNADAEAKRQNAQR